MRAAAASIHVRHLVEEHVGRGAAVARHLLLEVADTIRLLLPAQWVSCASPPRRGRQRGNPELPLQPACTHPSAAISRQDALGNKPELRLGAGTTNDKRRRDLLPQLAHLLVQDAVQKTLCSLSCQDGVPPVAQNIKRQSHHEMTTATQPQTCGLPAPKPVRVFIKKKASVIASQESCRAHRFTALVYLGLGGRPIGKDGCGRLYVTNSSSSSRKSSSLKVSA